MKISFFFSLLALATLLAHSSRAQVGRGTATPAASAALDVRATSAVSFSPSDPCLKEGLRPLRGALAGVLALRGVRYHYRQDLPGRSLPTGEQVGVVTQEVEKIYPELVNTDAEGFKDVNYAQLTPILSEALKEQQQIEALEKQTTAAARRAATAAAAPAEPTTWGQLRPARSA